MARKKSRKQKKDEDSQQDLREQLDSIIENTQAPIDDNAEQLDQDLRQGLPQEDYNEIDSQLKDYAGKLIDSIFEFYLENDLISQQSYVKFKKEASASNVASLFFQIKILKDSLISIMNQIQQGNVEPRMYEVLSQLTQKYNEAIKTQANFVLYLEDSFKKIAQEAEENDQNQSRVEQPNEKSQIESDKEEAVEASFTDDDDGSYVSAGTKDLIQTIKEEVTNDEDSADADTTEVTGELTDPTNKPNIITQYTNKENLSPDLKQESDDDEHNKSNIKKLNDLI
jgi:hypothetical protein